jgi:hypothetical protein
MERAEVLGSLLAERHGEAAEVDRDVALHHVAESPRPGGWTLRSALVRLAQPEPELAASIVEQVRRLETILSPVIRELEAHGVVTDPGLTMDCVRDGPGGPTLRDPGAPRRDARMADLARLLRCGQEAFSAAYGAYRDHVQPPITEAEQRALPLLGVALDVDDLADVVVEWARRAPAPTPPSIAPAITAIAHRLDALGVPREQRTMPPGRR